MLWFSVTADYGVRPSASPHPYQSGSQQGPTTSSHSFRWISVDCGSRISYRASSSGFAMSGGDNGWTLDHADCIPRCGRTSHKGALGCCFMAQKKSCGISLMYRKPGYVTGWLTRISGNCHVPHTPPSCPLRRPTCKSAVII